ncbi:MAG: hypothetical protein ACREP6_09530, partial [Candidatus Binataceae bacterium]
MRQSKARIMIDGIVAGLIGAVVIALWFLAFDAASGEPLETPALLAASLLPGLHHAALSGNLPWLLAAEYTAFHFCTFAAIGLVGALMMEAAQREPALFPSLVIFLIAFEVFFIAVVMMLGPAAQAELPWWKVIIGNGLATISMLAYFFWRQPALGQNLLGPWIGVALQGIAAGIIGAVIVAAWFLIYDSAAGAIFRTPSM